MTDRSELVSQLQDIGLSGYEAKAYLALISQERPLNGYEVAKQSGVPRSTVYETLAKLAARGAAFEVHDGETTAYVALPSDALLRRVRDRVAQSLDTLARHLDAVTQPLAAPVIHRLDETADVVERAVDLIAASKRQVYVSGWDEQLEALAPALDEAHNRGVDVVVLRFGDGPDTEGRTFQHVFPEPATAPDRGGLQLTIVVQDRSSVVLGGSAGPARTWGLYSDHPAVVFLAVEYLRNDIGFQVLVEHVGVDEVSSLFASHREIQDLARGWVAPGFDRWPARPTARSGSPARHATATKAATTKAADGQPAAPRGRRKAAGERPAYR